MLSARLSFIIIIDGPGSLTNICSHRHKYIYAHMYYACTSLYIHRAYFHLLHIFFRTHTRNHPSSFPIFFHYYYLCTTQRNVLCVRGAEFYCKCQNSFVELHWYFFFRRPFFFQYIYLSARIKVKFIFLLYFSRVS